MSNYIFISYAHKDAAKVMPVVKRLKESGYNVWYDAGIDPGTEWDVNIATHIVECSYFIAFMSNAYLDSSNCKDELNFARDEEKKRFLVYIEDVTLPIEMRMRLSRIQNIFMHKYSDTEEFYKKLFAADGIEVCKDDGVAKIRNRRSEIEENVLDRMMNSQQDNGPAVSQPVERTSAQTNRQGNGAREYEQAEEYYYGRGVEKNYETAFGYYIKAAEYNHSRAQFALGWMYAKGQGVEKDYDKALEWYRKSADQGYKMAQFELGEMYYYGRGVEKSYEEAFRWYEKSAKQNYLKAMYSLGWMYAHGQAVETDYDKAMHWCLRAAEQGHKSAQYEVAELYYYGRGTEKNYEEALRWYEKSALQGNKKAEFSMGWMYSRGQGTVIDYGKALEWYQKSAEQNYRMAQYEMGEMYYHGRGVDTDYVKALEWYGKAWKNEYAKAKERIETMVAEGYITAEAAAKWL